MPAHSQLLIGNSQIDWTLKGGTLVTLPTSEASGEKPGKYLKNRARAKDKGEEERIHNSLHSAVLKCTHTELISGSGERTLK